MFDQKIGDKMLDKILSQKQISKKNSTENVSKSGGEHTNEIDDSLNLKIKQEFGANLLEKNKQDSPIQKKSKVIVEQTENQNKQSLKKEVQSGIVNSFEGLKGFVALNSIKEEQKRKKFRKGFEVKKKHFDYIIQTPPQDHNEALQNNNGPNSIDTQDNQSTLQLRNLKVIMDQQQQEMITLGDNPLKVSKKPLKSIKQFTPVSNRAKDTKKQQSISQDVQQNTEQQIVEQQSDKSKGKKNISISKSLSSNDKINMNAADQLQIKTESIIVTRSNRRKRSTSRNDHNMIIKDHRSIISNDNTNAIDQNSDNKHSHEVRSKYRNKSKYNNKINNFQRSDHNSSIDGSPESIISQKMEFREEITNRKKLLKIPSGFKEQQINLAHQLQAKQIKVQLDKLQRFILKALEKQIKLQLTEIQMFKDLNLLPQKMQNKDILNLLLNNRMGQDEIVELEELRQSCFYLTDIEDKLINEAYQIQANYFHNSQFNKEDQQAHHNYQKQLKQAKSKLDEFRKSALIITEKIYQRLKQLGHDFGGIIKVKEMRLVQLDAAYQNNPKSSSLQNSRSTERNNTTNGAMLIPVEPPVLAGNTQNDIKMDIQSDQQTMQVDSRMKQSAMDSPDINHLTVSFHTKPSKKMNENNMAHHQVSSSQQGIKDTQKRTVSNDNLQTPSQNTWNNPIYQTIQIDEFSTTNQKKGPFQLPQNNSLRQSKQFTQHQKSQNVDIQIKNVEQITTKIVSSPRNLENSKNQPKSNSPLYSKEFNRISQQPNQDNDKDEQVSANDVTLINHDQIGVRERKNSTKLAFNQENFGKTFQFGPEFNAKSNYLFQNNANVKKNQPLYTFRNGTDLEKRPDMKQRSVLKLLNQRSFNELGDQQFRITSRIQDLSKMLPSKQMNKQIQKVSGMEQKINEQIKQQVYKNMPAGFESARSISHYFSKNSSNTINNSPLGIHYQGDQTLRKQSNSMTHSNQFISSLKCSTSNIMSQKEQPLVIDNRLTCLFRDYYKVIGSRYKFKLEELLCHQKDPKLQPSLSNYLGFKQNQSTFKNLPTTSSQPALAQIIKFAASSASPSANAKKKLDSRRRRRQGTGQVSIGAALGDGIAGFTASTQYDGHDTVGQHILHLIREKYYKEINSPMPQSMMQMRQEIKHHQKIRVEEARPGTLNLTLKNVNVYPSLVTYHMDNIIKKQQATLVNIIEQSSPKVQISQNRITEEEEIGVQKVTSGIALKKVQEDKNSSQMTKILFSGVEQDRQIDAIIDSQKQLNQGTEWLEQGILESDALSDKAAVDIAQNTMDNYYRMSSPKFSAKNILTQRYDDNMGHVDSLKSLNLPENLNKLSVQDPNTKHKLTQKPGAIFFDKNQQYPDDLDLNQNAKFIYMFDKLKGEQKIKIDDHFQARGSSPMKPQQGQKIIDKKTIKEIQKQQRQHFVGEILKMTSSANISTPICQKRSLKQIKTFDGLEGQKILLVNKNETQPIRTVAVAPGVTGIGIRDSGIEKGEELLEKTYRHYIKTSAHRRNSYVCSDGNKQKFIVDQHVNLDESESDDIEPRKISQAAAAVKSSNIRPNSAKKIKKKSILLKNLHDKSSTKNLLNKTWKKNNADLSNVSDSPNQKQRILISPGKSTVKKQSLKFEFGGSSSKFFTDQNSPTQPQNLKTNLNTYNSSQNKHSPACIMPQGEKQTLLQRVASPIDQIMIQHNNANLPPDLINLEIGSMQQKQQQKINTLNKNSTNQVVSESPEISNNIDNNEQQVASTMNPAATAYEPIQKEDSAKSPQKAYVSKPTSLSLENKSLESPSQNLDDLKNQTTPLKLEHDPFVQTYTASMVDASKQKNLEAALTSQINTSPEGLQEAGREAADGPDNFTAEKIVAELNMFENQNIDSLQEESPRIINRALQNQQNLDELSSSDQKTTYELPSINFKASKLSNHQIQINSSQDKFLNAKNMSMVSGVIAQKNKSPKKKNARQCSNVKGNSKEVIPSDFQSRNSYQIRGGPKTRVFGGGFCRNQEDIQNAIKKHKSKQKNLRKASPYSESQNNIQKNPAQAIIHLIQDKEPLPSTHKLPISTPIPRAVSPQLSPKSYIVSPLAPVVRHPIYLLKSKNIDLPQNLSSREQAKIAEADEDY